LILPSFPIISGLAAMKLRAYMTFCAMSGCAQSGAHFMSKLEPQPAAMLLFMVCILVYDPIAAMSESFCIMAGIIEPTEVDGELALGGLMTANIPFWQ